LGCSCECSTFDLRQEAAQALARDLAGLFPGLALALENTRRVAERCAPAHEVLPSGPQTLPRFPVIGGRSALFPAGVVPGGAGPPRGRGRARRQPRPGRDLRPGHRVRLLRRPRGHGFQHQLRLPDRDGGRLGPGGAELSPSQKRLLMAILRERGGEARASDAWERELQSHLRAASARRDLAFRLSRLAALGLAADDAEAVSSLLAYATGWRAGRMQSLSPVQSHLVEALEARNFDLRRGASQALARELAGEAGQPADGAAGFPVL
jgi:hypothetical protein